MGSRNGRAGDQQHTAPLTDALPTLCSPLPLQGQAVVAAGPGALLTMKLNLHRLALLLSLASQSPPGAAAGRCPHRAAAAAAAQQQLLPTPLLELAATALTMDVHDVGVGWLEATVATHLQLDVFSSSKQGWEPVLEPWQCR